MIAPDANTNRIAAFEGHFPQRIKVKCLNPNHNFRVLSLCQSKNRVSPSTSHRPCGWSEILDGMIFQKKTMSQYAVNYFHFVLSLRVIFLCFFLNNLFLLFEDVWQGTGSTSKGQEVSGVLAVSATQRCWPWLRGPLAQGALGWRWGVHKCLCGAQHSLHSALELKWYLFGVNVP